MVYTEESYIGKGKIYVDGRFVGNVPTLTFGASEEEKTLPDYTSAGGGNRNVVRRVSNVTCTFTMNDFSPENLALALRASAAAASVTPVANESHTANHDRLIVLPGVNPTSVTVTSDPAGTTYVLDTDYTVTAGGIMPLSAGNIPDGAAILISYTPSAGQVIEALVNSGVKVQLVFEGLNEAQSGKAVVVVAHRVSFGVAANLGLIADEFGALELSGEVEADPSITAVGKSKFYRVTMADAA